MNPKLIISNYFDSLINQIDIHTEEELAKFKETDLINTEKPFKFDIFNKISLYGYNYNYESFIMQPSRHIPLGSVGVVDFLNETRMKLIEKINAAQVEAFKCCDQIKYQLNEINKDVTKSKEQKEDEIKGKVFAKKFLGILQINQIDQNRENKSPFKLYLVELDFYMNQDEQFLLRYYFLPIIYEDPNFAVNIKSN